MTVLAPPSVRQHSGEGQGRAGRPNEVAREVVIDMTSSKTRQEIQLESLARATNGQSLGNWPAILRGFVAKGIAEEDILPRVNVFTYNAWLAQGRQVRRGEHGVKVVTFLHLGATESAEERAESAPAKKRKNHSHPWTATVFHVSQTEPV